MVADGRIVMDTAGSVPTVVKRAEGTRQRSRLAHEAAMLAHARHPGVVRVVEYRTGEDVDELITEFAGAATLADHAPAEVTAVAGLGAAIADIVADLHQAGLAHGALHADHVVLGARRRPVLCGFSSATLDAGAHQGDVVALGHLLAELLAGSAPGRRGPARRSHTLVAGAVDAAVSGSATARELAMRLAVVPGATIAADDDRGDVDIAPDAGPAEGTRTWRHRVVALPHGPQRPARRHVVGLGVGLALVVSLLVAGPAMRGRGAEGRLAPPAAVVDVIAPRPPTTPPAPPPRSAAVLVPAPEDCAAGPDVDGDGCGDDTEVVGHLIRHGATWFRVGDPGDAVVLGHWGCAEVATPAVLRPATGEVFVFDRWPTPDEAVHVVSSSMAPDGATSLVRGEQDGCDAPVASGS